MWTLSPSALTSFHIFFVINFSSLSSRQLQQAKKLLLFKTLLKKLKMKMMKMSSFYSHAQHMHVARHKNFSLPGQQHLTTTIFMIKVSWIELTCNFFSSTTRLILIKTPFNILLRRLRDTFEYFSSICPSFTLMYAFFFHFHPKNDIDIVNVSGNW